MRLADTRPPFAGLANLSEAALAALPTPCYLLDEARLRRNGEILLGVQQRTGCKILLAQKAFSNYDLYPVLAPYLAGTEASGLYESRLGREELPEKENHVFCAAYRADQFEELLQYADHIVFNSPHQLAKFGPAAKAAGKSVGLRVNPEHSTQEGHEIYDPCAPGSRLGTTRAQWDAAAAQHGLDAGEQRGMERLAALQWAERRHAPLRAEPHTAERQSGIIRLPAHKGQNAHGAEERAGARYGLKPSARTSRLARTVRSVSRAEIASSYAVGPFATTRPLPCGP